MGEISPVDALRSFIEVGDGQCDRTRQAHANEEDYRHNHRKKRREQDKEVAVPFRPLREGVGRVRSDDERGFASNQRLFVVSATEPSFSGAVGVETNWASEEVYGGGYGPRR